MYFIYEVKNIKIDKLNKKVNKNYGYQILTKNEKC